VPGPFDRGVAALRVLAAEPFFRAPLLTAPRPLLKRALAVPMDWGFGLPGSLSPWVDAMTTEHVCPKCQSKEIDRVARQDILERLILMLRRKRLYRCRDCDYRFNDHPVSKQ